MGGWDSADVVSAVLASTGIGLTVIGLGLVLWQVRQARGAAEAAREAASEAREAMAQRVTAADLGSIHTGLRRLLDALQNQQGQSAQAACQEVREQMVALRARSGLQDQQEHITEAITTLSRTQDILERESQPEADIDMNGIRAILDLVVEIRERALFFAKEGDDHGQRPD